MSYCNSCRARLPEAKDLEIQHAFSIETFLDSGEFTDFEFRVKMEDHPDIPERRVRVHKLFLAMRNEVFRAMLFCGDLAETCGGVIITDVHPDGFDLLLSPRTTCPGSITHTGGRRHSNLPSCPRRLAPDPNTPEKLPSPDASSGAPCDLWHSQDPVRENPCRSLFPRIPSGHRRFAGALGKRLRSRASRTTSQ
ncbi:hypothetical protein HPB49_020612 [Dermacentor silvarum]|uniref:Uncharacterized protein n=1 Tax=Dermacentor silvarum TaxID=543639 RepID=A0ACB8CH97_DERSI|nr:hypothetical protein HPB49_020612 [Dermacentor silvarum]